MQEASPVRSIVAARRFIGVLLAVTALFGVAFAQNKPSTITFAQSVAVTDLGPAYGAFLNYPAGYEVGYVIYDRLVTFNADLKIVPQLATSWETSSDGLTWTFHLRHGVKFQDGTPFDAQAVKFNIERMMDPKRNTTNRPLWDPIAGAKVVDPYTVQIITKKPYAMLLNTLAHGSGAIVSPTAIEKNGDKSMTTKPVGTGPYMLDSFTPGQEVVLKSFPDYWGGKPPVDRLVFKYVPDASTRVSALRAGQVDVIDDIPPQLAVTLKSDPNVSLIAKPGLRPMGFAINSNHPPFGDVRVRQALNYAVPRDAIAKNIFLGYAQPADSPLAFNTFGHKSIGGYSYDPAKAKQLLADAGWTPGPNKMLQKDGKTLTLNMYTPEGLFPGDVDVAQVVAKSLEDIGIKVNITKLDKGGYWDYLRQPLDQLKWDAAMFGFNPSNGAGTYQMDSLFVSNPNPQQPPVAWNITRYDNSQVDSLVNQAKVTIDPQKRADLLGQAEKIVWNDAPYIWLQVNESISATRSNVAGVEVWPTLFTIVRDAHLK